MIAKLARAVASAHEHGILHRDLKPANVLFDAADKPFVADFGLAKWVERECDLTQTLGILGTPFYMAPEQAANSRAVTAAVGVLVAGIVLIGASLGLPAGFSYVSASGFIAAAEPAEFKTVTTPEALDNAVAKATQTGRPVIIDFSAKWCVECRVMDRTLFSDQLVRKRLRDFDLIRADATDYNDDSRSMMKRFGVVGPPTVIFLDANEGEEVPDTRIIGPVDSATFLDHLNHLRAD